MVTVVGLGFVGLTTALGLCEFGNHVYGIDVDEEKLQLISEGKIPFAEPNIEDALNKYLKNNFQVTDDWIEAVSKSTTVFYCVGTPYGEDGKADLTFLLQAIDKTMEAIDDNNHRTLVIKSTVPPSTASSIVKPYIDNKYANKSNLISIANNPEFLREGHCWEDFIHADRIVIGVQDEKSRENLTHLYSNSGIPIHSVSLNTAEYIKYLSNNSLAVLISFANEMSLAADKVGDIDIAESFRILHQDKRWQTGSIRNYMYPGCGYGGYCLPKDSNAFYAMAKGLGVDCKILGEAIKLNDDMPARTAEKIALKCDDKNTVIGILGLSFNAGSDDVRDTPAAKIIKELNNKGYNNILAFDPAANETFRKSYADLCLDIQNSMDEVIDKSNVIAILTAWKDFKNIKDRTNKKIIDCRYML